MSDNTKQILLIAVNYHTYEAASAFIRSVDAAAALCPEFHVKAIIADNDAAELWQAPETKHIECDVVTFHDNPGYLGAALQIYNQKAADYDFVSISNVDLTLGRDFFAQLCHLDSENCGWIAPDIYTAADGRHENPYMTARPTKRNFFIWSVIYSCTLIYKLYNMLHLMKKQSAEVPAGQHIYAAHGSFMLFTRAFTAANPELHFPSYMYGEEIYFAELVRRAGLKTVYLPELKIANQGHANTGGIATKLKSQWSKESLEKIRELYFK